MVEIYIFGIDFNHVFPFRSVKTEAVDGGADSTLLVARLNSSDSGRYTCSVGTDLFAVVNVHVLNGWYFSAENFYVFICGKKRMR